MRLRTRPPLLTYLLVVTYVDGGIVHFTEGLRARSCVLKFRSECSSDRYAL